MITTIFRRSKRKRVNMRRIIQGKLLTLLYQKQTNNKLVIQSTQTLILLRKLHIFKGSRSTTWPRRIRPTSPRPSPHQDRRSDLAEITFCKGGGKGKNQILGRHRKWNNSRSREYKGNEKLAANRGAICSGSATWKLQGLFAWYQRTEVFYSWSQEQ